MMASPNSYLTLAVHHNGDEIVVDAVLVCNGGRRRGHAILFDSFLVIRHPEHVADSLATGSKNEMAGSAREINDQGRVLHTSFAAVGAGPDGGVPFSSPTWASAGLVAVWTSLTEDEMQGFSSESSCTGRPHDLHVPGTLGGQTWVEFSLMLGLFTGLARQSESLGVVVL